MKVLARATGLILVSCALGLVSLAVAHPIFCDRFETDSCLVLPRVTLASPDLVTFDSGELIISLEKGPLPGGQDVFLSSSDNNILSLPDRVRMEEGETELLLTISTQSADGVVSIEASATGHQTALIDVLVSRRNLELDALPDIEVGYTEQVALTLGQPAPIGGMQVSLFSSNSTVISVTPPQLVIAAGETAASINVTGLVRGEADLSALASGYKESTMLIRAFDSFLQVGEVPSLVPRQDVSLPITLSRSAPPGGLFLTLETSDPEIAMVDSIVEIPEGQRVPAQPVLVHGISKGQTTLSVSKNGWPTRQRSVSVGDYRVDFGDDELEVSMGSTNSRMVRLSSGAPPGGITLNFSSSNENIASALDSVSIPEGDITAKVEVTGVGFGRTKINVHGNDIQTNSLDVEVIELPDILLPSPVVGSNLQSRYSGLLTEVPKKPLRLVLTVADPSIAVISANSEESGFASIALDREASSSFGFTIQGLRVGSTLMTATAPGYADAETPIIVTPSGVYFSGVYFEDDGIRTTTISREWRLYVRTARLESEGAFAENQRVRAGLDLAVFVNSTNPSIGSLSANSLLIEGGILDIGQTDFLPQSVGVGQIFLSQPAGFINPIDRPATLDVQVSYPHGIRDLMVGEGLQATASIASSVELYDQPVTLVVGDPSIASLSLSSEQVGEQTIELSRNQFNLFDRFYVQGLKQGVTTLTSITPGFPVVQSTISVTAAGFYIRGPSSINTSSISAATSLTVAAACRLASSDHCRQELRPGLSIEVPVVSTNPAVGEVTVETLSFGGEERVSQASSTFLPKASGSSIIRVIQPAGFSEWPELRTSIEARVEDFGLSMFDRTVGEDLMISHRVRLTHSPADVRDIVVRALDPSITLLSPTASTAPSAEIVLAIPGEDTFFVHGIQQGETTLIAYGENIPVASSNLSVVDSGFYISKPAELSATIYGGTREIEVTSAALIGDGRVFAQQELRYGLELEVPVFVADEDVAVVSKSPLIFDGTDGENQVALLEPLNFGKTVFRIEQPEGFSIPENGAQSIEVEVGLPKLEIRDIVTGRGLQVPSFVRLRQDPLGLVDLELSITDPSIAVLSDDFQRLGSPGLTLLDVEREGFSGFFVQGLEEGTTTLIARVPGFEDLEVPVSVTSSGVEFRSTRRTVSLKTGDAFLSLKLFTAESASGHLRVNPGSSVIVPIGSSNPAVGDVTINPVEFSADESNGVWTSFSPESLGTATLSIEAIPGFEAGSPHQVMVIEVVEGEISSYDLPVGENLQIDLRFRLDESAAEPLRVTASVADSSVARVSASRAELGGTTAVLDVEAGSTLLQFYVQGMRQGTTTLNVSADGYKPTQTTITVMGSGFFIAQPNRISTSHYSSSSEIVVVSALVESTGAAMFTQELRPGLSVHIPLSIADPEIGELSASSLLFTGGNGTSRSLQMTPNLIGETTIAMEQPQGFLTPINRRQQIDVVVEGAPIQLNDSLVGKDLQAFHSVNLGETPPQEVDLVLTIDDPSIARLSLDSSGLGSSSVTLGGSTSTESRFFRLQGLQQGVTSLRAQALGYVDAEAVVRVTPSGVAISRPSRILNTIGSNPTEIEVETYRLHDDGSVARHQNVRPDLVLEVPLLVADSTVGVVTNSPLQIDGSSQSENAYFIPLEAGSSSVDVVQPTGFTAPTDRRTSIPVQVEPRSLRIDSQILVGENLQVDRTFSLNSPPISPVDVSISVADPNIALVSLDGDQIGTPSLVVEDVANAWSRVLWIQGLAEGTTTITLTAPGYVEKQAEVIIADSGFYLSAFSRNTTVDSNPTSVSVQTATIWENRSVQFWQPLRAGLTVEVPVTSVFPSIGQVTQSPVVFSGGGSSSVETAFDPQGVGTTWVTVVQPPGFSTPPEQSSGIDFVVRQPDLDHKNAAVGIDIQIQ